MRHLAMVALSLMLLIAQAWLGHLTSHPWIPNLILPLVMYVGVSPAYDVLRGSSLAFVMGYLADLMSGCPLGLQTFAMVFLFLLARTAGLRLHIKRLIFQLLITFLAALFVGAVMLVLQAVFANPTPYKPSAFGPLAILLIFSSLISAAFAPWIFYLAQIVEAKVAGSTSLDWE